MVLVVSSETAQVGGEKKKKFLHQNKCGWEKRQQTTRKGGKQVEDEGNVICQSQLRNSMQLLEKKTCMDGIMPRN